MQFQGVPGAWPQGGPPGELRIPGAELRGNSNANLFAQQLERFAKGEAPVANAGSKPQTTPNQREQPVTASTVDWYYYRSG